MTNLQNPERAESTAGWALVSKRPSRGKYLLVGLICLALLAWASSSSHAASQRPRRDAIRPRRQRPSPFERGPAATFPRYQPRR